MQIMNREGNVAVVGGATSTSHYNAQAAAAYVKKQNQADGVVEPDHV